MAGKQYNAEMKTTTDFDMVMATFHFPSGAIGTVELVRHCSFGHDQRVEVFGSQGCLTSPNETPIRTELWNK